MNIDANKTKEQLLTELAELRRTSKEQRNKLKAANQQLVANSQQLQASEQTLKKQTHKLGERVKELNCLHSISEMVRTRETMEEILQDVTEVIPPAWQYPKITCSKITLKDKEYKSENYKDTQWKLSSEIRVNKKIAGKIEVCYLEEKSESDIGPFLNEERILLDIIAERLGRIIERKNAEETLKVTNQQLEAQNQQLQATEQQLRAANQQLNASNQQLIANEQSLLESKEKYRILADNMETGLVLHNPETKIIYSNQKAGKILGLTQKQMTGKKAIDPVWKFLREDGSPLPLAEYPVNKVIESGKTIKDYQIGINIPGRKSPKWVLVNAIPVLDKNGMISYVSITFIDITERKEAEEALKASEEKFSKAFDLHPSSMAIIDIETLERIAVNDYFVELVGYSREKLMANPLGALGELDPEKIQIAVKAVKKGISLRDVEVMLTDSKGSKRVMSYAVEGIKIGERNCMIVSGSDITKRKQAEEEIKAANQQLNAQNQQLQATEQQLRAGNQQLIASEAKFKSYMQNAPDGIFIANEKGKYIEVNNAACEITGYSEDELLKLSIPELIQEEYSEKAKNHFQTVVKEGFASGELGFVAKSGEKRFWSVDAVKLSETRFLGFAKDITDRKHIEEMLEKRMVALIQPLESSADIAFDELFNLADIQKLQDQFAEATGVASIITHTDGTPITKPSNFCRLCNDIIRKTDKGLKNCFKSDAILGKYNPKGPTVQPCLSGGLWDAGAAITVGGKHIANWLIGQVRDETQSDEKMKAYAKEIGADEVSFIKAFHDVPSMSKEQFEKVAQALYTLANQLSTSAYQNVQQAQFINEREQVEVHLKESEKLLRRMADNYPNSYISIVNKDYTVGFTGGGEFKKLNLDPEQFVGLNLEQIFGDKADFVREYYEKTFKGEEQSFELFINDQYQLYRSVPLTSDDGSIDRVFVVVENISERKQAEKALKESERKNKAWIENSPVCTKVVDLDFNLQFMSESGIRELKIEDINDYYGKPYPFHFYPKSFKIEMKGNLEKAKESGKTITQEASVNDINGNKLWYQSTIVPVNDNEGKLDYLLVVSLETTARKHAEENLKQKNEQFETIIKGANLGWWDWDIPSGDEIYNDILAENLGYKLDEIKPHIKWWEDKIHPDDTKQVYADLQEHFDGKTEFYENKHRLKTKSGKWKWFLDFGKVVERDDTGKAIRMIGTLRDIDFETRAQEKIKENLKQIEVINANTPNIIWKSDIDKQGNFINTYVSEGVDEFLDLPKGTINNSWDKYLSYVIPDYLPQINKLIKKGISNPGEIISFDYEIKKADGSIAWFSSKGRSVIENNKLTLYGSTIDITQNKQAEEQLKESEAAYRALTEAIPDLMFKIDEDLRFTFIHAGKTEKLLIPEEEALNKSAYDLLPPELAETTERNVKAVISTGEIREYEYSLLMPDGIRYYEARMVRCTSNEVVALVRNVTERKQAETEIFKINRRLKISTESARIGIWDLDLKKNVLTWDKRMFQLYGIEPEKFEGAYETWKKGVHPDDIERSDNEVQAAIAGEKEFHTQFRVVWPDGQIRFIEAHAIVNRDRDGTPKSMIGVNWDITERKQAEERLKESEERFKALHNASFGGIAIHDKGVILECNLGLSQISGFSRDELIGAEGIALLIAPESHKTVMNNIRSGDEKPYEVLGLRKNGEKYPVRLEARQIPYKGKNVRVVEFRDITERKQGEEALRKSEAIKNTMVSNIGDVIVIIDQNEITQYKSPNLTKLFGWAPEELVGKSAWDTVHPDDLEASQKFLGTIATEPNATGTTELRYKRKDGNYVWIEITVANLLHDNDIQGFLGNYKDISERKKAEQELTAAKEKAEESDRLKSAFLMNMSHEIRTPMNGILGFTELLKEPQLSGDEKEKYIQVIEKSGNRMLNTINDIIDISIIEAGQVKVLNSEVSVNSILDEQYNFFLREAESKGLKFNYKPSLTDSESRIFTDPHKLEGILTNLLKNAVKYTETGEITMGCSVKDKADDTFIEFYVKDTGIGIPANRVDAVFNRFEQADIADTQAYEGSGLGLAISKSYVQMLGGEISVNSKEGEGSTFTFSIPYNKESPKENGSKKNNEKKSQVSLNNLSVIVAEDDETSRMFFETILENQVKGITYTKTGKETIEKLREHPDTDIILMDIKMPDMNGYDATREIRKYNRDVIIIAQTAYGLTSDKEKALEAGCDEHISKPIKKEILFEKIRMCLDKKSI